MIIDLLSRIKRHFKAGIAADLLQDRPIAEGPAGQVLVMTKSTKGTDSSTNNHSSVLSIFLNIDRALESYTGM